MLSAMTVALAKSSGHTVTNSTSALDITLNGATNSSKNSCNGMGSR